MTHADPGDLADLREACLGLSSSTLQANYGVGGIGRAASTLVYFIHLPVVDKSVVIIITLIVIINLIMIIINIISDDYVIVIGIIIFSI